LKPFVATIISAGRIQGGCLTIDQAVFEPKNLIDMLSHYSIPPRYGRGSSVTAVGRDEVEALLQAAFSDWVDFLFLPEPKSFAIYADHDAFATFYAHTRSNLNRIAKALSEQPVKTIRGYERRL
jgi:hypothetical protein